MRTGNMIEDKKNLDIQKNHSMGEYDDMNNISKSRCKGKCLNFKATRPVNGSWYASGYSRCNVCDIFVTPEGVRDGRFCNCCNIRVRTKPRAAAGKERYFEQVKKIVKTEDTQSSIDENNLPEINSTVKLDDDKINDTKKSTPIYEENDESVKTYYELKDFLESKIKPQANYQYVMLKELLEYGELHKGDIAESLAYFNNKNTTDIDAVKYYLNVPVYDVLLNHELVTSDSEYYGLPYYTLNVKLTEFQRIELIDFFIDIIDTYNKEHDIPENQFPNANNSDNIEWSDANIKSSSKVQKIKNFVKKIHVSSTNSFWIWSVTPDNWEIVKSQNVWGSRIPKERIGKKVKSGDQVAFYVIGSASFKGIFEFVGEWHDSPGKTWDDDLEPDGSLRYKTQIKLKPVQLGSVDVSDLHDEIELFIGKPQNIRNLLLQGGSGYPSNNSRPLLESDFVIIKEHLAQNALVLDSEESTPKIVKECPKCNETKVEGIPGNEFDNKIEELFGFRQFDPNDPQSKKPQSYCRKCRNGKKESESIEENKISKNIEKKSTVEEKTDKIVTESEKFLEFVPQENGLVIKHYELKKIDIIQKDQNIPNDELVESFGVGNMGGIRHSKKNNVLILCSTFSNQYEDDVDEDAHLIKFTGEGQSGDQTLSKGNYKIANSENTPMLFFKEKYQEQGVRKRGPLDNIYSFVGKVRYVKHYWKEEQDVNGLKRQVLKFVLEIQS